MGKVLQAVRCVIVYLVPLLIYSALNIGVTLKSGLEVTQGH